MTESIGLTWDDAQLVQRFARTEKQTAFAVVNALNATALRIEQAEFEHVASEFIIRKPGFFFGTAARPGGVAARIKPFASVKDARPYVEIGVSGPSQSSERRTILPLFEEGGERQPFIGKHVAVPILGRPARPSITSPVPPAYTFQGLAFKGYLRGRKLSRRRRGRTVEESLFAEFGRITRGSLRLGQVEWKGRQRTFILGPTENAPYGGVFQRYGPGRADVRVIYKFEPPFHVDTRLHWMDVARSVADTWLHEEIERAVIDMVQHNAGKAA